MGRSIVLMTTLSVVGLLVVGDVAHGNQKTVTPPGYYTVPVETKQSGACAISGCHTGAAARDPQVELEPDVLAPAGPAKPDGEVSANADIGLWRYRLNIPGSQFCHNWATVRNTTNGFAMGLASEAVPAGSCYPQTGAWTFDVTRRSSDFVYYFGYAYGNYQGCGTIYASQLDPATGTPSYQGCDGNNADIHPYAFQLTYNSAPFGDGQPAEIKGTCQAYANVRPWSNPTTPTNPLRWPYAVPNNTPRVYVPGMWVRWRYVTKYAPYYVLVRDESVGENTGQANWAFIDRWCLGSSPLVNEVARQPPS